MPSVMLNLVIAWPKWIFFFFSLFFLFPKETEQSNPPLTTHGLLLTCDTTHSTVRQAVPERARVMPP